MATFGKVLAVINVLAAIGFLAIAGMDYTKRQNWAFAYLRGQLTVRGLPVDKDDDFTHTPGQSVFDQLGDKTLAEIFRGTQGGTSRTQIEEANKQLDTAKSTINGAANLNDKQAWLATYLLPLATDGDERATLITKLRDLKTDKDVEDLTTILEGYFQRAISPKKPTGEDRDYDDRRRSIADLLYNLNSTVEGRTRTQIVVGMMEYIGAADRQYANLRTMSQRLQTAITAEQTTFASQYQSVMPELSRLADELKGYEAKLAEHQELVQKHTVLFKAREAEAAELQQNIDKKKQEAAAERAALDAVQRRLFDLEQDFAKLQARNLQLESEIRAKTTGR